MVIFARTWKHHGEEQRTNEIELARVLRESERAEHAVVRSAAVTLWRELSEVDTDGSWRVFSDLHGSTDQEARVAAAGLLEWLPPSDRRDEMWRSLLSDRHREVRNVALNRLLDRAESPEMDDGTIVRLASTFYSAQIEEDR